MAEKEVRIVNVDEILEISADYIRVTTGYSNGKEIKKYDARKVICKTLDEARRKADDMSRNPSNDLTGKVRIKISVEKKKLFSKDTKIVDSWETLEEYYDGRLRKKSKKIQVIEEKAPVVDLWA